MGIKIGNSYRSSSSFGDGVSSSSIGKASSCSSEEDINPKPDNYKIIAVEEMSPYVLMRINYPNCKNYEGEKILVFEAKLVDIINQKLIDPHFFESKKHISPIARFVPTDEGWAMAKFFVTMMILRKKNEGKR